MIRVKNYSFKYGKKVILQNLNIYFEKGETTILAGPNGAGKTTLLRSICGILRSGEGRIALDKYMTYHNIRRQVAYIPSSLSLYENMRLSDAVSQHASFYNDYEFANLSGYNFDMGQKVGSLSRGERTLFYLSLVLGTNPRFLLIDDVIHFLDPHLRDLFRSSIQERIETSKMGIIIATQDALDIEGLVDRIVIINRGIIVEDSPFEKIRRRCVRVYSEKELRDQPVIFSREWEGMNEHYIYPYVKSDNDQFEVEYLRLSEILRAFIGGEYDQN